MQTWSKFIFLFFVGLLFALPVFADTNSTVPCICTNKNGGQETYQLTVQRCQDTLGLSSGYYTSCVPQVDYCCCRDRTDCQKLNGPYNNRQCSVTNFPNQPQLPDSSYTVQDVPASGNCSDLNDKSLVSKCCCRVDNSSGTQTAGYSNCKLLSPLMSSSDATESNPDQQAGVTQECGPSAFGDTASLPGITYQSLLPPTSGDCADLSKATAPGNTKSTSQPDTSGQVENLLNSAKDLNHVPSSISNVRQLVGYIIKILLSFIGSIALLLYFYAGVIWMTAAGNSEKTERAQQIFLWTSLGVAVMLGSYVVLNTIFSLLGQ